jgi:hypothetical protein
MHRPEILVSDSVTTFGPEARGAIAIAASHGGVISARMAIAAGIVGILLNDAGIGLSRAGTGSLSYCDTLGVPCAVIDHRSARIGDGRDNAQRGIVSYVNTVAAELGVQPGMAARDAANRLRAAPMVSIDPGPLLDETREVISPFLEKRDKRNGVEIDHQKDPVQHLRTSRPLVLIDSASMVLPTDSGSVVLTGSHGGLLGGRAETAIKYDVFAALYNDAGIGIDEAGVSRLAILNQRGIVGVTVAASSARIGSARSAFETGILSRVNRRAASCGAREGMRAAEFAKRMCELI